MPCIEMVKYALDALEYFFHISGPVIQVGDPRPEVFQLFIKAVYIMLIFYTLLLVLSGKEAEITHAFTELSPFLIG